MNKIILLLLLPIFSFSQSEPKSNWSKKSNTIYWEKTFAMDSIKAVRFFNENIKIPNKSKGTVINQKVKCPNGASYAKGMFNYSYMIRYTANTYTVQVSEIMFPVNTQVTIGSVTTSNDINRMEDFALRDKDGEFRKNSLDKTSLKCMDDYFTETFTVN